MARLAMGKYRTQASDDIRTEGWALVVLGLALSCGSVVETDDALATTASSATVPAASEPADPREPTTEADGAPVTTRAHIQAAAGSSVEEAREGARPHGAQDDPKRSSPSRRGDVAVANQLGASPPAGQYKSL